MNINNLLNRIGATLAILLIAISTQAHSANCSAGSIIFQDGTTANYKGCGSTDPELKVALDLLNERIVKGNEQQRKKGEYIISIVNGLAEQMGKERAPTFSRSFGRELSKVLEKGIIRPVEELAKLTAKLEGYVEQFEKLKNSTPSDPDARELEEKAMSAVAVLDYERADELLGRLTRMEKKIDVVLDNTSESREADLLAKIAQARSLKSIGDIGQVGAVEKLTKLGKSWDGIDFSGVGLKGIKAPNFSAIDAQFALSDLSGGEFLGAKFNNAKFISANLERANLARSDISEVTSPFAQAQGINLTGANLTRSNWVASNLVSAKLVGTNLEGAGFEHADLSKADFRRANFRNAVLRNADLRDANFEGATFDNTDVSGAIISLDKLTAIQLAGLCATPFDWRGQYWQVIERTPSGYYSSGFQYDAIFTRLLRLPKEMDRPYPACKELGESDAPIWGPPRHDLKFRLNNDLLDQADRRNKLRQMVRQAFEQARDRSRALADLPQYKESKGPDFVNHQLKIGLETPDIFIPNKRLLPFDIDAKLLYLMAYSPSQPILNNFFSQQEQTSNGFLHLSPQSDLWLYWKKPYKKNINFKDGNVETLKLLRKWYQGRAAASKNLSVFFMLDSAVKYRGGDLEDLFRGGSSVNYKDGEKSELAAALSVDSKSIVTYGEIGTYERSIRSVLVIENSASDLQRLNFENEKLLRIKDKFLPESPDLAVIGRISNVKISGETLVFFVKLDI